MKLGLTQKYLLCILGKKGKVSAFGIEKYVGLTAAGVLELLQGGVVRLEGKKLSTQYSLPQGKEYLQPVYQYIEEKQPVSYEKVMEYFSMSFSDKRMNAWIDLLGESLAQENYVRMEEGKSPLGTKQLYFPKEEQVQEILGAVKESMFSNGIPDVETVSLALLLDKGDDLYQDLPRAERKKIKRRVKELKVDPVFEQAEKITGYVDTLLVWLLTVYH